MSFPWSSYSKEKVSSKSRKRRTSREAPRSKGPQSRESIRKSSRKSSRRRKTSKSSKPLRKASSAEPRTARSALAPPLPPQPTMNPTQEVVPVKISPTELIQRVLRTTDPSKGLTTQVSAGEIAYICRLAHKLFLEQPSLIEIEAPVKICGDVHGQFADLLRLFNKTGFPPSANYLFLGDYVDRGKHNLETIMLLLGYKLRYPKTFFLLRGNHELSSINRVYGFLEECVRRYGTQRVYMDIQDVFTVMPLSAVVGEKILCMHGGLSPVLNRLDDLRNVHRPFDDPPPCSLECDVMWADPMPGVMGFINSPRGTSHVFGEQALKEKCDQLKIDLVVRAHQVVQDGYEFFAGRKLVTIFSAPHYCAQFDNAAAVLCVDKQLKCSFEILKAKFLTPKT